MAVVNDFVAHIDRPVAMAKRALDNVDRANDACTKSPGCAKITFMQKPPFSANPLGSRESQGPNCFTSEVH